MVLTSSYIWVPQNVKLPEFADSVQEEVDMSSVENVASLKPNLTFEFIDHGNCKELHGFCEVEVFPEDTPGEDNVLINVGEVFHRIIESIRVTGNKIQAVNTRKRKRYMEDKSIFQPVIDPGLITEIKLQPHKTFISKE